MEHSRNLGIGPVLGGAGDLVHHVVAYGAGADDPVFTRICALAACCGCHVFLLKFSKWRKWGSASPGCVSVSVTPGEANVVKGFLTLH